MPFKACLAELLGTFVLALFVCLSVAGDSAYAPVVAAPVVLAVFVYSIGWISGAHLNPAVTIGLATIRKIGVADATYYVLAQLLGAALAMAVCRLMTGDWPRAGAGTDSIRVVVGEAMGAFLLVWAILSVVEKKTPAAASGLVVGFGLMLGLMLAASLGTAAILNPAVAFGVGSLSISYLLGPIVGSIAASWCYRALAEQSGPGVAGA
jgi:aquaporin Z